MQALTLVKTIPIEALERQTLLILPASFLKNFGRDWFVSFREVAMDVQMLSVVQFREVCPDKTYKLVTSKGSSWVSVPRDWLRNINAQPGDLLDLYSTVDPNYLLLKHRRA